MAKVQLFKRNKPHEVLELIRRDKRDQLIINKLVKYHAFDISEAIESMDVEERDRLFKLLSPAKTAEVFAHMPLDKASEWIVTFEPNVTANLLALMEPDDAVDILERIDQEQVLKYIPLIDEEKREHLKQLLHYGKSTAGSEMNNRFIRIQPDIDVKAAMKKLVQSAADIEMIDTLFVLDEDDTLLGIVDLKDLIVAKSPKKISEIMQTNVTTQTVYDDIEEVTKNIQKYDIMAMPILDEAFHMCGVITMYDALDIIEKESGEDYAKLAAISSDYDRQETAVKGARRRLPWLVLLLVLNVLVTLVLSSFVETIDAVVALVLFQPLILGMAGNIGTQSLAVTILSISKESLHRRVDIIKHLSKEFSIGVFNGIILGGLAYLMAFSFLSIVEVGTVEPYLVAIVLGLSVFTALSVSAFLGSAIPLTLNALKIDPAVASGPFITTINDITALVVYFTLAGLIILPTLL